MPHKNYLKFAVRTILFAMTIVSSHQLRADSVIPLVGSEYRPKLATYVLDSKIVFLSEAAPASGIVRGLYMVDPRRPEQRPRLIAEGTVDRYFVFPNFVIVYQKQAASAGNGGIGRYELWAADLFHASKPTLITNNAVSIVSDDKARLAYSSIEETNGSRYYNMFLIDTDKSLSTSTPLTNIRSDTEESTAPLKFMDNDLLLVYGFNVSQGGKFKTFDINHPDRAAVSLEGTEKFYGAAWNVSLLQDAQMIFYHRYTKPNGQDCSTLYLSDAKNPTQLPKALFNTPTCEHKQMMTQLKSGEIIFKDGNWHQESLYLFNTSKPNNPPVNLIPDAYEYFITKAVQRQDGKVLVEAIGRFGNVNYILVDPSHPETGAKTLATVKYVKQSLFYSDTAILLSVATDEGRGVEELKLLRLE